MGLFRMAGPVAGGAPEAGEEILSEACLPGERCRVPANGLPIALMADHQTTGGLSERSPRSPPPTCRGLAAAGGPAGRCSFARCTLEQGRRIEACAARPRVDAAFCVRWRWDYRNMKKIDLTADMGESYGRLEDGRRRRGLCPTSLSANNRGRLPRGRPRDHPQDGRPRGGQGRRHRRGIRRCPI